VQPLASSQTSGDANSCSPSARVQISASAANSAALSPLKARR